MQSADELILLYFIAEVDERLPYAVVWAGSVVLEVAGIDENGLVLTGGINFYDVAGKHSIVPENILNAGGCMQDAAAIDRFAEAEFAANGDFAFGFSLVGQQSRGHLAGIDQHEGRVEQSGYTGDFGELRRVGYRMERCAEGESAFAAAGVHIDDYAHPGKNVCLDEVGDAIGDGAARIAGEGAVHVDVVEGRSTLIGSAGTLAELWHENNAAADLLGVELLTEFFDGNLTFPLVSVGAAESGQSWWIGAGGRGAETFDHGERYQGISPPGVEVKRNLVMVLAGFIEIDLIGMVNDRRHTWAIPLHCSGPSASLYDGTGLTRKPGHCGGGVVQRDGHFGPAPRDTSRTHTGWHGTFVGTKPDLSLAECRGRRAQRQPAERNLS